MFSRKIPFYVVLIAALLGGIISFLIFSFVDETSFISHKINVTPATVVKPPFDCTYKIERLNGYHYIKPLMMADQICESEKYAPIKTGLINLIENYKSIGVITSASVYIRDLNQGQGLFINEEEKYDPGSLMKVPLMITFLRMSQENPALLNRELAYDKPVSGIRNPIFLSETIQLGRKYTVRQLLDAMIAHSDNAAASLLVGQLDAPSFKKTFSDLGLPEIDVTANKYPLDARDFSVFMEALYNGGYLTIHNSEYAMSLLGKCDFKDGIVNGLPVSTMVAHKFGEGGESVAPELHESAIVYYKNSPYLITIMTRGKDLKQLPAVLSSISKLVYDNMGQAL